MDRYGFSVENVVRQALAVVKPQKKSLMVSGGG
jgi:hypothetical protein